MSGFEEVARVTAVVGADLTELVSEYARGEKVTERYAATTKGALDKAEQAAYRSSASMAKALERASVANTAAAAHAERAMDRVVKAHHSGASAAERASTKSTAAIRAQASSVMQAAAQMGQSHARMSSSAMSAAAQMQSASSRAISSMNSQAAAARSVSAQVIRATDAQADAAERAAARTNAAQAGGVSGLAGRARNAAGLATAGAGFAAVYGLGRAIEGVVRAGASFEQTMSGVRAATGATQAEFQALEGSALTLGKSTAFSATEVGAAYVELGKAGMDAQQSLAAMPGILDAAAASGEGIAPVAKIAANSLAQFNLDAGETQRIADVLAQAANMTQGSITTMGDALSYAGTGASQLGFDIEQTAAMISMMVKAGIEGSMAGTATRMGLAQIAKGANASRVALKKLATVSPELAAIWKSAEPAPAKLRAMSAEFVKMDGTSRTVAAGLIFGQEASSGMIEVLKGGPAAIDKWTSSMRNSKGAAEDFASVLRDNFAGDLEELQGALETGAIKVFKAFQPQLREGVSRLKVYIDSDEFVADAKAVMGVVLAIGETMADTVSFVYRHRDAIVALGVAYAGLKVASSGAMMLPIGGRGVRPTAGGAAGGRGALAGAANAGMTAAMLGGGRGAAAGVAKYGDEAAGAASKVAKFAGAARSVAKALPGIGLMVVGADLLHQFGEASKASGDEVAETASRVDGLVEEIARVKSKKVEVEVEVKRARASGDGVRQARAASAADALDVRAEKAREESLREIEQISRRIEDGARRRAEHEKAATSSNERAVEAQTKLESLRAKGQGDSYAAGKAQRSRDADIGLSDEHARRAKKYADEVAKAEAAVAKLSRAQADLGGKPRVMEAQFKLEGMDDAERQARFGTDNVNKILKMMGFVKVSGRWYDSLTQGAAIAKAEASKARAQANSELRKVGAVAASPVWSTSFKQELASARAAASNDIVVRYRYQRVGALPNFSPLGALPRGGAGGGGGGGGGGAARGWDGEKGGSGSGGGDGGFDGFAELERARRKPKAGGPLERARRQAEIDASLFKTQKQAGQQYRAAVRAAKGKKGDALKEARALINERARAFVDAQRAVKEDLASRAAAAQDAAASKLMDVDSGFTARDATNRRVALLARGNDDARDPRTLSDNITALDAQRTTAAERIAELRARINGPMNFGKAKNAEVRADLTAKLNAAIEEQIGLDQERTQLIRDQADALRQEALDRPRAMMQLTDAVRGYELAVAQGTAGTEDDRAVLNAALQDEIQRRAALAEALAVAQQTADTADDASVWDQLAASVNATNSLNQSIVDLDATIAASTEAQLAKVQAERDAAVENARLSEAALATFRGPGDLGYAGGATAWESAQGMQPKVDVYVQSLTGYSPEIREIVGEAAGGGFTQGGNAFRSYNGRG